MFFSSQFNRESQFTFGINIVSINNIMNFNNPYHPLYNPFMQGINPNSPWLMNSPILYPPINYPPPLSFPYPQNAQNNPFLFQQNNFYSPNFTSNTQQKPINPFYENLSFLKTRHNPNQKRVIQVQDEIYKSQTLNKNKSRIAEIIEIEDSGQVKKDNKQQITNQKTLYANNIRKNKQKLEINKHYLKPVLQQKNPTKNIFLSKASENRDEDQIENEKLQINEGGLRRSKRNSQKYTKKIKKIIQEQMNVNLCPRKSNRQNVQNIKQQEQKIDGDKFIAQEMQIIEYQRAIIPSFSSFQVTQTWKLLKKEDLLTRTLI